MDNSSTRKLLGWLLSPLYLAVFVTTVLVWHPMIAISYLMGMRTYRAVISAGNGALLLGLRLMGTRIHTEGFGGLPRDKPLIVVSNHQSLYDIPLLLWYLRRVTPRFIAKQELGKGVPSASHALRNMGSALIDRGDAKKAIATIERFGAETNRLRHSAVIFPEGTRARDGKMKSFKPHGLQALLRTMPDALVVPVVISGSWHLTQWKMQPVYPGAKIAARALGALPATDFQAADGVTKLEAIIRAQLPAEEAARPSAAKNRVPATPT